MLPKILGTRAGGAVVSQSRRCPRRCTRTERGIETTKTLLCGRCGRGTGSWRPRTMTRTPPSAQKQPNAPFGEGGGSGCNALQPRLPPHGHSSSTVLPSADQREGGGEELWEGVGGGGTQVRRSENGCTTASPVP